MPGLFRGVTPGSVTQIMYSQDEVHQWKGENESGESSGVMDTNCDVHEMLDIRNHLLRNVFRIFYSKSNFKHS